MKIEKELIRIVIPALQEIAKTEPKGSNAFNIAVKALIELDSLTEKCILELKFISKELRIDR